MFGSKLSVQNLSFYLQDNWTEYASCTVNGKRLKFEVNGVGQFIIMHGDEYIAYKLKSKKQAVDIYNEIASQRRGAWMNKEG